MEQKQLFTTIEKALNKDEASNHSLARALTESTNGTIEFDYQDGTWHASAITPPANILYYKTSDNLPIDFEYNYLHYPESLPTEICNHLSCPQVFDEETNMWTATFENDITSFGVCLDRETLSTITEAGPIFTRQWETPTAMTNLTYVSFPPKLNTIGTVSMAFISGLTDINFPNTVTGILQEAIGFVTTLKNITIPSSTTFSFLVPFVACSLETITVDPTNPVYGRTDNCNALILNEEHYLITGSKNTVIPDDVNKIGWAAFAYNETVTGMSIPETVTGISAHAFKGCTNISSMTLPYSIQELGSYVFAECSNLTSLTVLATTPPNPVTPVHDDLLPTCTVYVPAESLSLYQNHAKWKNCNLQAIQ